MFENFPYTNFHDLNLDWLIDRIMSAYGPDNPPPIGLVLSVNGETGAVVLYRDAIVRLPDIEESSWNIHRIADGSSSGIEFVKGQPAMRIDGVNRYKIYDEGNPPPGGGGSGAVDSVDGMTGVVKTWANTNTPELDVPEDSSGFYWDLRRGLSNGDTMGISFEYDSVNQTYKTYLIYTPYQGTQTKTELLTSSSLPPSGVITVNGQSGIVVLTGANLPISVGSQDSIKDITDGLRTDLGDVQTSTTNLGTTVGSLQTALGTLQTQVGGLQTTVSGLNGALIPIEANSQQSIKQYIDNVQPGGGSHRKVIQVVADGVKTYRELLNQLYPTFQAILAQNAVNPLYIVLMIGGFVFHPTGSFNDRLTMSYAEAPVSLTIYLRTVNITESTSTYYLYDTTGSLQDWSNNVPSQGLGFAIYI